MNKKRNLKDDFLRSCGNTEKVKCAVIIYEDNDNLDYNVDNKIIRSTLRIGYTKEEFNERPELAFEQIEKGLKLIKSCL